VARFNDYGIRPAIKRLRVQLSAVPFPYNDAGQVVNTCASLTKQYNLVLTNGGDILQLGT